MTGAAPPGVAAVSVLAIETADPTLSARRAVALLAPTLPQKHPAAEADMPAAVTPDGTSVFFCRTGAHGRASWMADFLPTGTAPTTATRLTHIDHVALAQTFDQFDEASLFYCSVLGLTPHDDTEYAAPFGLVRSRAVSDADRRVRIALSGTLVRRGDWAPGVPDPQHVAFATDDVFASARAIRAMHGAILEISSNYYDDLDARLILDPELLEAMRECSVLHDRDEQGEYFHLYTQILGTRVFFEIVQRLGSYDCYGASNAPVRMAAHRRYRMA